MLAQKCIFDNDFRNLYDHSITTRKHAVHC